MRAHLHGGVPKTEVDAHRASFERHAVNVESLFVERDADYWDFADLGGSVADIIAEQASVREAELRTEFEQLWEDASKRILDLADGGTLVGLRSHLIDLFQQPLTDIGPLDRFQTAGIVARWWDDHVYDLQTLDTRGIDGLIDAWLTTAAASEDDKNAPALTDQPIIAALVPHLLAEREELASSVAGLDATIRAAETTGDEDEGAEGSDPDEDALSEEALKRLRSERTAARKQLRKVDGRLLDEATTGRQALTPEAGEALVLGILYNRLTTALDRHVAAQQQHLIETYRRWHDKYAITLRDL